MLDSFKSFLSAISNVEGIDSLVGQNAGEEGDGREEEEEEEGEYQYNPSSTTQMNVNFDLVYDILNGIRSLFNH